MIREKNINDNTPKLMKVRELVEKLNLKVYSGESGLDNEITGGCYGFRKRWTNLGNIADS